MKPEEWKDTERIQRKLKSEKGKKSSKLQGMPHLWVWEGKNVREEKNKQNKNQNVKGQHRIMKTDSKHG